MHMDIFFCEEVSLEWSQHGISCRKLRRFDLKNENRKIWVEVILNTVRDSRNLHSKEL